MRIKTQFVISMVLFGLMLSVIAVSVAVTSGQVARLDEQEEVAEAIGRGASELGYLAGDYVLFREEQQRVRWDAKWTSVSEDVARIGPVGVEERALGRNLRSDMTRLRAVFEDVVRTTRSSPRTLTPVLWSRMAVQNQSVAFDASRLSQLLRDRKADIQRRQGVLIVVLLGIFGAYFGVMYSIVYRRALRSLAEVQAGTEIIGGGDLGHTIPVRRNDEVGDLSRAFNKMASDLKGVTASKRQLEEEVAERQAAEEALQESAAQMEELSEAREKELSTTRKLLEAAEAIAGWTDLDELVRGLADVLLNLTGRSRSAVNAWDAVRREIKVLASAGETPYPVGTRWSLDRVSSAYRAAIEERHTTVWDLEDLPEAERGAVGAEFGVRYVLYVPLVQREKLIGMFVIDDPGERREFEDREISLVQGVAAQAAVAIQNARLFATEHDIADRLQAAQLLLPDDLPGIEFARAYRSATEVARVGGDFYDLFDIERDLIGVTIGDVAGKGLDAAVLTSLVKNSIRAHAHTRGAAPARVLALTNDVVYKATSSESFATVFFGILDRRDGRLTYSSAAHTTAAVVRKHGAVDGLPANGPLLGAFLEVEFAEDETCLDCDEVLFVYTDGLTEASRDGDQYGEDRLLTFLSGKRGCSTESVVDAVMNEVTSFTRDGLRDDVAILALRRVDEDAVQD